MTSKEAFSSTVFDVQDLSIFYGDNKAVNRVDMKMREKIVTAVIGPSGCGKSTLLRSLNRMNDFVDNLHIEGQLRFAEELAWSFRSQIPFLNLFTVISPGVRR